MELHSGFTSLLKRVPYAACCLGLALTLGACAEQSGGGSSQQPDSMATATPADTAGLHGQSVFQTAQQKQNLSQFTKALQTAGLAKSLSQHGPFTIFAPTDSAFQALPQKQRKKLMSEKNRQQLRNILTYHVVQGKNLAVSDLQSQSSLTSMQGGKLTLTKQGQHLMVGNAKVLLPSMQAGNGIIYPIDAVLRPQ